MLLWVYTLMFTLHICVVRFPYLCNTHVLICMCHISYNYHFLLVYCQGTHIKLPILLITYHSQSILTCTKLRTAQALFFFSLQHACMHALCAILYDIIVLCLHCYRSLLHLLFANVCLLIYQLVALVVGILPHFWDVGIFGYPHVRILRTFDCFPNFCCNITLYQWV